MDDRMEKWAIRETFRALYKVGLQINSAKDAHEAIDLAARMLSYAFKRDVDVEWLEEKMKEMMTEDLEDNEALANCITVH